MDATSRETLLRQVQDERRAIFLGNQGPTWEYQALVKKAREAGITSTEILEPLATLFAERYEAINNAMCRPAGRD